MYKESSTSKRTVEFCAGGLRRGHTRLEDDPREEYYIIFCKENKRFLIFFPASLSVSSNQIVLHEPTVESMPHDVRSNHLIDKLKTIQNEKTKFEIVSHLLKIASSHSVLSSGSLFPLLLATESNCVGWMFANCSLNVTR